MSILKTGDGWLMDFWARSERITADRAYWKALSPPASLWKLVGLFVVPVVILNGLLAWTFELDAELLNGLAGVVFAGISFWRRHVFIREGLIKDGRKKRHG